MIIHGKLQGLSTADSQMMEYWCFTVYLRRPQQYGFSWCVPLFGFLLSCARLCPPGQTCQQRTGSLDLASTCVFSLCSNTGTQMDRSKSISREAKFHLHKKDSEDMRFPLGTLCCGFEDVKQTGAVVRSALHIKVSVSSRCL